MARIQLAKKVGSLRRSDKQTMCKASTIKIFGPIRRRNPRIRVSQSEHFARSVNVKPASIEAFNRKSAFRPEQDSINSTHSL